MDVLRIPENNLRVLWNTPGDYYICYMLKQVVS